MLAKAVLSVLDFLFFKYLAYFLFLFIENLSYLIMNMNVFEDLV